MTEIFPFAILLPTTSKSGKGTRIFDELSNVATNLREQYSEQDPFHLYFGVDDDDLILASADGKREIRRIFRGFNVTITEFPASRPPRICSMWSELAKQAWGDKCKYFILYGDDVSVQYHPKPGDSISKWPDMVHQHFLERPLPFFGCLALNDRTSPGFPTFPIVTDLHMEIFNGRIVPTDFINQDGDPYIWALYRRFSAATSFIPTILLSNHVGGAQLLEDFNYMAPRYERVHIHWKDRILQDGVERISRWIRDNKPAIEENYIIDVIVPSYRVMRSFLERIIRLHAPSNADVMTLVIVDDPRADITWLRELEKENNLLGKLRVRKNTANLGAPQTRNVGLDESSADWVLFLDDDVVPQHDLINEYVTATVLWV